MSASMGERRVVSVLLADIADSTSIGEKLGPERSKFLFDEVVRLVAGEVKRFGGTVAQYTGDGLYALFGAPSAHEDDAERAVRAALAIHEVLTGYGREVAEAYGIELSARVGINTGPVVLLAEEAPPEKRYNALGDTVNVAARLQSHAGAGGVAVGPATARQLEGSFELEALGPLELKGKTERVEAFLVTGEKEEVERRASPLVGRERELELLDDLLAGLADGKGALVVITGEPGIGKSRLVAEARDRRTDEVRFLFAHGVSYAQDVPYYPLRELLRGFLELGLGEPEAQVRLELKTRLASAFGERADDHYPFLASLLGLALEELTAERLDGLARDSIQHQTHEAVLELCRSVSRERPLCLVLEDLHFADRPTLDACRELLSLADEEAVAVLLLYRSDPDLPSWGLGEAARRLYRHRFHELELRPLDRDEGALLAASAAGGDLSPERAAELAERTGGNPLFLEEAARDLVERGDGAAVPAAIEEALQARLDRLAPEAREVASVASVVGRTFGWTLLERVVAPDRLRPALSELQRHDLVVEQRRRPSREYRFRHGLVQEAAYRTLLEEHRRELHKVVGNALEELHEDELSEAYGLLARHFAEADEPLKAAKYLLAAGDKARSLNADDEAIAQYRRALSFLDRLGDSGRARSALFKIATTHHLAFDFEAANAAWAEAFERPEPSTSRSEPTERIEATVPLPRLIDLAPGYSYDYLGWSFAPNLYRGLLRLDTGLDVVPDLAERVEVSADGRIYRFTLQEGAQWTDGVPITASDFEFTYPAMRERSVVTTNLLAGIEFKAADARTVELRCEESRSYIPYLLAQVPLFPWPRHYVEAFGDSWPAVGDFVGSGPFVPESWDDEQLVLSVNPYWKGPRGNVREIALASGHLHPGDRAEDWRSGRADFFLSGSRSGADDAPDTITRRIQTLGTSYLLFNSSSPPLDDERVRRALAHGLDRAGLVQGTGDEPARGGFVPPAMPGHAHDLALAYDLEVARSLLAEAGYPGGRGLPEIPLAHTFFRFAGRREEVEARWESTWRGLGVRLRHEWLQQDLLVAPAVDRRARPPLLEWAWFSDYPDPDGMLGTFLAVWLKDPELAAMVAHARSLHSREERLRSYRRIDRRLVAERVDLVPISYDAWFLYRRPWLKGLRTSATQLGSLERLVVER